MEQNGYGAWVCSAITVSREELSHSPVLRALLPEADRPERLAIVLVGYELRQETLLVDSAFLEFAQSARRLNDAVLEQLDLPRQALVARVSGWPDTWDSEQLAIKQPHRVRGVWEFPGELEPDHPLL